MPSDVLTHLQDQDAPWRQNLSGVADAWLLGERSIDWWTGQAPLAGECPGLGDDGTLTALPLPNLATCTRQDLLDYFDNGWTLTEVLFSALQGEEAFYRPPYHHLRHPLIFYYAHPAVLYVNKLRVAGLMAGPLNEYFEQVFETGVDEMSWDDMSKNTMVWPSVLDVHAYRKLVYATVRQIIETHPDLAPGHAPITRSSPLWAVVMGFEHERIHLETSSVLIRELPVTLLRRPAQWPSYHPTANPEVNAAHPPQAGRDFPVNEWLPVAEGTAIIGKERSWPSYGWDNEYGRQERRVAPFHASRYLISNGEFHAFVQAGGYRERRYWSDEGWSWRRFRNLKWPVFWVPDGPAGLHQYKLRAIFDVIDMPWSWPVDVTYHEAKAYCAWRREQDGDDRPYRLLTEAEHHRLRNASEQLPATPDQDPAMVASGRAMAARFGRNLALAWGSESPVDALLPASTGFHDVCGNVWQWCEDHFHPLPGMQVDPLYDDFSTPCFDGKHQLILGGSFVSAGDEASLFARFHFRPHFTQHAGFRMVVSADGQSMGDPVLLTDAAHAGNVYESEQVLNEYLLLHYGSAGDQMPYAFGPQAATEFPARCARLLLDTAAELGLDRQKALDVGCAVGRSTFELARDFGEVIGVDLSAAFIQAGQRLQRDGILDYWRKEEGDLGERVQASIDPAIDRSRVTFRQADACSLPAEYVGFDAVLAANLICRLPSPKAFLGRLAGPRGLVRPGGLLVLMTPFTWLEQFTPKEVWLGGYEKDGEAVWSQAGLTAVLEADFELLKSVDLPLVIREHARKYQYIVSLATVWRRKG